MRGLTRRLTPHSLGSGLVATLLAVSLTGCVTWETEEVVIDLGDLRGGGIGTLTALFGPVGSDEAEPSLRDRDFGYFLYDIIENPSIGAPELFDVTGEVVETPGGIYGRKRGSFVDLKAIAAKLDISLDISPDTFIDEKGIR